MSEKHFSIFRHKNVSEVPHKSQYIRILGNHSICKSTLPGFPEGCLFSLTKDRTFISCSGDGPYLNLSNWIRGCGGYAGTG